MSAAEFAELVATTRTRLEHIAALHAPAALASSLAAEDMVLTDLILRAALPIDIFTLDTGRLHAQTLALLERIAGTYGYRVQVFQPQPRAVEDYVNAHGLNGFYDSLALRRECCRIRKVEPLQRALAGRRAWITGQRRGQSVTRETLALEEYDSVHRMQKFNPLADWTEQQVWRYLRAHDVPYNPLHDHGYPSIGCAPCTRPIYPGEDLRAGRWWWESADGKECGLHLVADADGRTRLVRASAPLREPRREP